MSIPPKLTHRLGQLRDALLTGLVERDVAVRLALIAALSGEHLLLLGPPGTAKSLIARRLRTAFREATYFERLLTRFTVPEELFGPLSIKGLEHDRYERLTEAYLPTASIAFLDEIFKANSAILNSLLTLLNEREFDNGTQRVATPLVAVIGASNEIPGEVELRALFDRFLLRLHVGPVSKEGFPQLLGLRGDGLPEIPDAMKLTAADLERVRSATVRVVVPEDVVSLLRDLRDKCTAENIAVSDRRWRKVVKLLQVSAITNGRDLVSIWDCWLLQHCLGDQLEDRQKIYEWYEARVGAAAAMDPTRVTKVVAALETSLKRDKEHRSQMRDEKGAPMYTGLDGVPTTMDKQPEQKRRGTEPLYLAPAKSYLDWSCSRPVTARANNGKGYTEYELGELYMTQGSQFAHWGGRAAYLADRNNWHTVDRELAAAMEPTRHKPSHIQSFGEEVERHQRRVLDYRTGVQQRLDSAQADVRAHLWVLPTFADPALASLRETALRVDGLLKRLAAVRAGVAALPPENIPDVPSLDDEVVAPAPVPQS